MQSLGVEETVAAVERLAIDDTRRTEEKKLIWFQCSEGVTVEVEEAVAMEWLTIKEMAEDVSGDGADVIPLPNVGSKILSNIIDYTKKHLGDSDSDHDHLNPCAWDVEFVNVDTTTLYYLMMAANYLNIPRLLDLTAKRVADMISECKCVKKIRETFNIVNDYTPEEEEEIRRKYPWAFEEETNSNKSISEKRKKEKKKKQQVENPPTPQPHPQP